MDERIRTRIIEEMRPRTSMDEDDLCYVDELFIEEYLENHVMPDYLLPEPRPLDENNNEVQGPSTYLSLVLLIIYISSYKEFRYVKDSFAINNFVYLACVRIILFDTLFLLINVYYQKRYRNCYKSIRILGQFLEQTTLADEPVS